MVLNIRCPLPLQCWHLQTTDATCSWRQLLNVRRTVSLFLPCTDAQTVHLANVPAAVPEWDDNAENPSQGIFRSDDGLILPCFTQSEVI